MDYSPLFFIIGALSKLEWSDWRVESKLKPNLGQLQWQGRLYYVARASKQVNCIHRVSGLFEEQSRLDEVRSKKQCRFAAQGSIIVCYDEQPTFSQLQGFSCNTVAGPDKIVWHSKYVNTKHHKIQYLTKDSCRQTFIPYDSYDYWLLWTTIDYYMLIDCYWFVCSVQWSQAGVEKPSPSQSVINISIWSKHKLLRSHRRHGSKHKAGISMTSSCLL